MLPILLLLTTAQAASRLMIITEQSAVVVVDGTTQPPSTPGQRVTISSIAAGAHAVQIRDLSGQIVYDERIDLPDGVQVQARWSGSQLTIETPGVTQLAPPTHSNLTPGAPSSSTPTASASGGAVAEDDGRLVGTRVDSPVLQSTGQVAQSIATSAIPSTTGTTIASGLIGSGVGSAVVSGFQNSPAGTSLGTATPTKQIRKPDPATVTGKVIVMNQSTAPVDIYVSGMLVATAAPGESTVRIAIGQQQVELWLGGAVLYRGELQVDESVPVQLAFSETASPQALSRRWAWVDR